VMIFPNTPDPSSNNDTSLPHYERSRLPVEGVRWDDAQRFLWLMSHFGRGLISGHQKRMSAFHPNTSQITCACAARRPVAIPGSDSDYFADWWEPATALRDYRIGPDSPTLNQLRLPFRVRTNWWGAVGNR
jgi:hypothetical protein